MTPLHPLARRIGHPAPLRERAPAWLVIAGLLAAPAAWSIQLLTSYLLNGDRCANGLLSANDVSPGASILEPVIGALALGVCLFGLWSAYHTWRLTRNEGPGDHHVALSAGVGRTRFLGLCGLVSAAIFLVATGFILVVPFLVSPCAAFSF